MTSLLVYHDDDTLDLATYPIEELRTLAEAGGVLYWDLWGLRRKVPNAVLRNALRVYDDCQTLLARRGFFDRDHMSWLISFSQTVTPRSLGAVELARPLHPTQP